MPHDPVQAFGNQSRGIALVPATPVQVLAIPTDPDERTTWMVTFTNQGDGGTNVVTLALDFLSPSGVQTQITTELGAREEFDFYVTRGLRVAAVANVATQLQVVVSATGGSSLPCPPLRFSFGAGFAAYANMSATNGYAPPGRRWFNLMSNAPGNNFDVRIIEGSTGNILLDVPNLPGTTIFREILPPGSRLTAKGNAAPATLTTTWTQERGR
jgi:hypothetical protein